MGNLVITDKRRFALKADDKRVKIWRKHRTRSRPDSNINHHTFRCRSIIVWVETSFGHCTDLHIYKQGSVTSVWYPNKVLEPNVKLHAAAIGPSFALMDDNARPHRAATVGDFLESKRIVRMEGPEYSPDHKPTENRPISSGAVLLSKLADGRCQVQSPVTLVDLAVRSFPWFFSESCVNIG